MQVAKWGNSLAIRLPAIVVEVLDLHVGDEIQLRVAGDRELAVERTPDFEALLEKVRALRGRWPADFKFNRDEANER